MGRASASAILMLLILLVLALIYLYFLRRAEKKIMRAAAVPRNEEIFDIKRFGRRLMLYSAVIVSICVVCFPMLYIFVSSFKPGSELVQVPPTLFPGEWTLDNYRELF